MAADDKGGNKVYYKQQGNKTKRATPARPLLVVQGRIRRNGIIVAPKVVTGGTRKLGNNVSIQTNSYSLSICRTHALVQHSHARVVRDWPKLRRVALSLRGTHASLRAAYHVGADTVKGSQASSIVANLVRAVPAANSGSIGLVVAVSNGLSRVHAVLLATSTEQRATRLALLAFLVQWRKDGLVQTVSVRVGSSADTGAVGKVVTSVESTDASGVTHGDSLWHITRVGRVRRSRSAFTSVFATNLVRRAKVDSRQFAVLAPHVGTRADAEFAHVVIVVRLGVTVVLAWTVREDWDARGSWEHASGPAALVEVLATGGSVVRAALDSGSHLAVLTDLELLGIETSNFSVGNVGA